MDDQQGANRQGGGQETGGDQAASKGINPVQHSEQVSPPNPKQHSEKAINPAQPSETRKPAGTAGTPAAGDPRGGGVGDHE